MIKAKKTPRSSASKTPENYYPAPANSDGLTYVCASCFHTSPEHPRKWARLGAVCLPNPENECGSVYFEVAAEELRVNFARAMNLHEIIEFYEPQKLNSGAR